MPKLQLGKYYRLRNGRIIGPIVESRNSEATTEYHDKLKNRNDFVWWMCDGEIYNDRSDRYFMDVKEEVEYDTIERKTKVLTADLDTIWAYESQDNGAVQFEVEYWVIDGEIDPQSFAIVNYRY